MDNYRQIAFKYLKLNKRRCIVTVLGVMVAVAVLYTILNLGWSRLLQERKELREEQDYEIVFFTETAEQVAQLTEDERVKSALVGQYYNYNYYEPIMYENALYVNTTHPYRMEKIFAELVSEYGVEGKLNTPLAETYLQGGEGNMTFILIMYVLLISYIFAIFGVGIVRNSIQLSILEQIKDYGNLRCVGSTKKQLKTIVYIQGAILELIGNALGFVLGFIASLIIGYFLKWEVSFHVLPMVPILIAFLGDLYFAMDENCKVLVNMTPVSAIRGEYRIRKEKIKARKRNIFGRLFGVEGDYAYKSLMRNPGRFHKTVWALGVGMAAYMAVMGATATARGYINTINEISGYYHVYYTDTIDVGETISQVQGGLPSAGIFQAVSNMKNVTEAKRTYSAKVLLKDGDANFAHYTENYLLHTSDGQLLSMLYGQRETPYLESYGDSDGITDITCYGYDEADYQRYEQVLVDGTLDVSENGIVLINGGSVSPDETNGDLANIDFEYNELGQVKVQYTDYKVGDTIDIVDMEKYRALFDEQMEEYNKKRERELDEYYKKMSELEPGSEEAREYNNYMMKLTSEYIQKRYGVVQQCKERLLAEGAFKTYTIEGIVNRDVNHYKETMTNTIAFVLPLERYFAMTGTDESVVTGMQYHFDMFPSEDFSTIVNSAEDGTGELWVIAPYPTMMAWIATLKILSWGILLFVTFVVLMTTFNIINTTASNLHLRRKEFAQLRVVGISKERLMKMVMLEGVIADIVASIIGILLGILLSLASYGILVIMIEGKVHFPFLEAVIGILVATLITCGSVYVPLRGLKQDMAADLATGGD